MSDHILYRSSSLSEAAAELNRLMDALDDVAAGLARVDTSAEWWSKVGVATSAGRSDARSALSQLRTNTGRARSYVSEVTGGVSKAQTLFDDAERRVSADIDAVSTGRSADRNTAPGTPSSLSGSGLESAVWKKFLELFRSKYGWDQILKGAGYFGDIYGFIKDIRNGKTWTDFAKAGVDIYQFIHSASKTWSNYMKIGNAVGKKTAVQWWLKNVTGWKPLGRASAAKNPWTRFKNNLTNKTSPYHAQIKKIIGDFSCKNGAGKCIAAGAGVA